MEPTWLARCAGFPQANIQLSCMAIFTSKGVPVKLDTVTVSNFRSIESVTLAECGSFNVLIGKNNAGKSNILLAIHTFFSCFRSGEPVFLDPPTGATLDHHKSEPNSIKITIGFQLSPAERDELVREMSAYAPQVKNTVELMPCELGLEATATIPMSSGPTFAYISKVAFYDYPRHAREHAVISVDSAAADELAGRARRLRQLEVDRMYLQNILRVVEDNADLARCKNDTSRALSMMSFRAGATPLVATPETQRIAEDLIRNATEYSIFSGNINGLASSKSVDALEVKKQPLENRIESLSGRESVMPEYALAILRRIGATKVTYLTERREPIGRKEAAQLLELKVRRGGPEKLKTIQETVSALLGVEIDAFRAETGAATSLDMMRGTAAELDVDKFLVQVNGAGIREALRLVLDYQFEQPNVLLVE